VSGRSNGQWRLRVLHVLHRAVISRQTRTKRLAARQCAAHESGLHVSDASLQLSLRNLEKSLAAIFFFNLRVFIFLECLLRSNLRRGARNIKIERHPVRSC